MSARAAPSFVQPAVPAQRPWAVPLRIEAQGALRARELPSNHEEDWKYTNLAPLRDESLSVPVQPHSGVVSLHAGELLAGAGPRVVTLNGGFSGALSVFAPFTSRVSAGSLAQEFWNDRSMVQRHLGRLAGVCHSHVAARNAAMMHDGVFVYLPPGVQLEAPLLMVHDRDGAPGASCPRVLVVAGEGSRATILEVWVAEGPGARATFPVTELVVRSGAALSHYAVASGGAETVHLGAVHAELARGSRLVSHTMARGGAVMRREVEAYLTEATAGCELHGLSLGSGGEHLELRTLVRHDAGGCTSRQRYRGVYAGRARGSFQGKVVVPSDAQHTDASQHNANLLLSEDAVVHARPQLEIFADDVRCTHGATVGQLDQEAAFYLQTRGIGQQEARDLLIRAFAHQVIVGTGSERYETEAAAVLDRFLSALPGRSS